MGACRKKLSFYTATSVKAAALTPPMLLMIDAACADIIEARRRARRHSMAGATRLPRHGQMQNAGYRLAGALLAFRGSLRPPRTAHSLAT